MVTFAEKRRWRAWRPGRISDDRVHLKPGRKTYVMMFSLATGCVLVSLAFLLVFRQPFSFPNNVIHAALWLVAVWAPLSLLYQGVEFVKEPERGTVYVVVHGAILSYQNRFPLRLTRLSLQRTGAYKRTLGSAATGVPKLLGYRWILRLFGPTKFDIQIGYSPGTDYPRTPPEHVDQCFKGLQELFEY